MSNDKIIGRFEPIGPDVGLPRRAFDVLTKEDWVDPKSGLPGFKGLAVAYKDAPNDYAVEYSVISEHWNWVPTFEQSLNELHAASTDGYRQHHERDQYKEPPTPADGGSAFGEYRQVGAVAVQKGGMSMRDYFAAKVLHGIVSNDALLQRLALGAENIEGVTRDGAVACRAYALADAMLEERKP